MMSLPFTADIQTSVGEFMISSIQTPLQSPVGAGHGVGGAGAGVGVPDSTS